MTQTKRRLENNHTTSVQYTAIHCVAIEESYWLTPWYAVGHQRKSVEKKSCKKMYFSV